MKRTQSSIQVGSICCGANAGLLHFWAGGRRSTSGLVTACSRALPPSPPPSAQDRMGLLQISVVG